MLVRKLTDILQLQLRDNVNAREMRPDGSYQKVKPAEGEALVNGQMGMYELLKNDWTQPEPWKLSAAVQEKHPEPSAEAEKPEPAKTEVAPAAKQAEADGLKAQYAKSIASVEEEKSKAMQETMKKADAEYQRIVGDAESKAKQIKEDAAVEAENQKTQILKKAEKEIADMVVDAAVKVVGKNSGADVDSSLYNEFLDKAGDKQ